MVLGAGASARMGGGDKLLADLAGEPVIVWSLRAFEACPAIRTLVVTTSAANDAQIRRAAAAAGVTKIRAFVRGGSCRAESVLHGLQALQDHPPALVAVHDGARPLVTPGLIARVVQAAARRGAAIAAVPATDTLKIVNADRDIVSTPSRASVWHAQTPQAARFDALLNAHERRADALQRFTDDASLLEAASLPVRVVQASRENLKITSPDDLAAAARIVRKRRAPA